MHGVGEAVGQAVAGIRVGSRVGAAVVGESVGSGLFQQTVQPGPTLPLLLLHDRLEPSNTITSVNPVRPEKLCPLMVRLSLMASVTNNPVVVSRPAAIVSTTHRSLLP